MGYCFRFLILIATCACSCTPVEFHQKQYLSDPIMQFDRDPTELHFEQKCRYSSEGSVGGIGDGAGGGCGCF